MLLFCATLRGARQYLSKVGMEAPSDVTVAGRDVTIPSQARLQRSAMHRWQSALYLGNEETNLSAFLLIACPSTYATFEITSLGAQRCPSGYPRIPQSR
jgi:hypothetical protein